MRVVYRLTVTVLWLIAIAIAMECAAYYRARSVERNNPFVQRWFAHGYAPSDAPPAALLARPYPPIRGDCSVQFSDHLGVPAPFLQDVLEIMPLTGELTEETAEKVAEQWSDWEETARHAFAMLHRMLIFHWPEAQREARPYGFWEDRVTVWRYYNRRPGRWLCAWFLRGPWQEHLLALEAVRNKGGTAALYWADFPLDAYDGRFFAVALDEGGLLAFLPKRSAAERQRLQQGGVSRADSAWDVPQFRYKAGIRVPPGEHGYPPQTNRFGFYEEEVTLPKPQNVFRIVCVGGSTTEEGPAVDMTYPARLEVLLNAAYSGKALPRIDVLNCGISGINSERMLQRLEDYLALEPDLVLYCEGINDFTTGLSHAGYEGNPLRYLARHTMAGGMFFPLLASNSEGRIREQARATIEPLHLLRACLASRGVPVIVASVPTPDPAVLTREEYAYYNFDARRHWADRTLNFWWYLKAMGVINAALREYCRAHAVPYVPLYESMRGGGYETFRDICHLTQEGVERRAALLAQALAPYLEKFLASGVAGSAQGGAIAPEARPIQ